MRKRTKQPEPTQEDLWNDFTIIMGEANKLKGVEAFILSSSGTFVTISINDEEMRGNYTDERFTYKVMNKAIASVKIDYSIPKEYSYLEPEEPKDVIAL